QLHERFSGILRAARRTGFNGRYAWVGEIRGKERFLIDEMSMCSCYMLECMDVILRVLRERPQVPLGGMRAFFVGDMLQLAPVLVADDPRVPPRQGLMAFESPVWSALAIETVVLTRGFRQDQDPVFQVLLHKVRWQMPLDAA